jgi:hypothetical protein
MKGGDDVEPNERISSAWAVIRIDALHYHDGPYASRNEKSKSEEFLLQTDLALPRIALLGIPHIASRLQDPSMQHP